MRPSQLRMITIPESDFNLDDTLDCGQAFRFEKTEDGGFCGVAHNRFIYVYRKEDEVHFYMQNESDFDECFRQYFDLDTDYQAMKTVFCEDATIAKACDFAGGIRLLQQEPWETLCSFIISQNNHIPRIKGIINRFCEQFGDELCEGQYTFPTPERIANLTVEDLAPLRAGFRAKYLLDAAQKVASGEVDFDKIANGNLADGQTELCKIYGVGKKVAQCVLLFGFHKLDAFPIDVWIKRVMERYFKDGFPEKAQPYAGVAQQYLFHYIRHAELEENEGEK